MIADPHRPASPVPTLAVYDEPVKWQIICSSHFSISSTMSVFPMTRDAVPPWELLETLSPLSH